MISVIVYGRNDNHGYNLHKRAAISLNCIAEMLAPAAGDEILFVDYNTPNDLPTFIEAIYDTLTPHARALLRVFRVRPELHARLVSDRTHLLALEPHSRNIALRRSNPQNRWVLFTNTDMIFVPRVGTRDFAAAIEDLPDGLYTLPRFELPEPLWEAFPRSDVPAILQACQTLGTKLHLEEVATSYAYVGFDAPGDFQLAPRQTLFDIHGFDERMIRGWHADSNLCKRLYLLYGRTGSLAHRLKGYHCDHTRVATLSNRIDVKIENDLEEFVNHVDQPIAPGDDNWGVPLEPIEEINFADSASARFVSAMERTLEGPQTAEYQSRSNDLRNFVYYQPEHALSYLAGNLTTYPRHARFTYVGNNPRMLQLVARSVVELGFEQPLRYAREVLSAGSAGEAAEPVDQADLLADQELLIFDFGLDRTGLDLNGVARVTEWPRELRYSLGRVARLLETCVEECEALSQARRKIPEFLVLNANHHVFKAFVAQFLVATETPFSTHVRKGRPRVGEERLYRPYTWKNTEDCLRSYFGYEPTNPSIGTLEPRRLDPNGSIDLTSLAQSAAYKDGDWGSMDLTGTWIDGSHASILFSPPFPDEDLLAYVRIVEACTDPGMEPVRIQALLEGEVLARWVVGTRYAASTFRVLLPERLMARKRICKLTFHVENPQSPHRKLPAHEEACVEDPRELGVKIQRITFTSTDRLNHHAGELVDFRDTGAGEFYLNEYWTQPDGYGTWTLGRMASLDLNLAEAVECPVHAAFVVTDSAINEEHPHMNVSVSFNQHEVGVWKLGPKRGPEDLRVLVPAEVLRVKNPVNVSFRIETPRSPVDLNWSQVDTRELGFRLTQIQLLPVNQRENARGERRTPEELAMLLPAHDRPVHPVLLRNRLSARLRRLRVALRGAG